MPLTGRFAIDFADLYVGVQRAELSLKSFTAEGAKVEKQLNRVADSLSGHKLIQDATLMAGAVEKLGGVSRLTADEQARVNKVVQDAIAKYKALGETAPHSLTSLENATRRVEDATRAVPKGLDSIGSSMAKMAGLLGIGFSVGAVVNFGRHVFDAASQIHDMASALGISVEATQRYKFAAEQSGATLEDVSRAINFMNRALAEPTDGTVAALKAAGLSFQQISQMNPEEAFNAITEGIKGIADPTIQARVQTELFSKSALALAPGIREGFVGIGKAATVMSTDTINSLEAAQDAWGKFGDRITIVSGNAIKSGMDMSTNAKKAFSDITSSFEAFSKFSANVGSLGFAAAIAIATKEQEAGAEAAKKYHDINLTLPGPIRKTKEELDAEAAALRKAKEATEAHAHAIQQLRDSLSGQGAIKAARDMQEALRSTIPVQEMTVEAQANINKVMEDAIAVYRAHGEVAPASIRALWTETESLAHASELLKVATDHANASMRESEAQAHRNLAAFGDFAAHIPHLNRELENLASRDLSKIKLGVVWDLPGKMLPAPSLFKSIFGDPRDFGAQMASAIQGAIQGGGNIAAAASGFVGTKIGSHISESLLKNGGKFFQGALGEVFAGTIPVIGSLIGPLAGAMWDKLFGSAGRDAVKNFASSFGGFDALHKQLNALGAAGEQLWIKLTQGVGKNNPEQAKAVIDEITKALDAQKAKAAEAGDAAAAQAGTVTEANQKALDAIKAMNDEMQGLFDSIKDEAPEEVMGVVERQTRDRIAAIQKERDAAQKAMDDTVSNAADAAKEAGDQIDAALKARQFVIRVRAQVEGLDGLGATGGIRGGPTPPIFHEAAGGDFLVTRPTLFLAGEAGPERATFSGGGRTGSSADNQPLHNVIQIDGLTLIEAWTRAKKRYVG